MSASQERELQELQEWEFDYGDPSLNGRVVFTVAVRDKASGENVLSERVALDDAEDRAKLGRLLADASGNPEMAAAAEAALREKLQTVSAPHLVRMSDVISKPIDWLWPRRFAKGKLSTIAGDPGLGKSFLTLDMIARVTTGTPWPDDPFGEIRELGSAILISAEDALDDTIRPRLDAAGADVDRVHALEGVRRFNRDGAAVTKSICLADLPVIEAALRQTRDCRLLVVDPVSAYLSDSDSNNNADVRGLLAPLAKLAEQYQTAVVMVTHMNKTGVSKAMYRAMGSLAFIAAARSAWLVTEDKDNPSRRLLLPIKNNIGNDRDGLAYKLVPWPVDPEQARVEWERGVVTMRADDALKTDTDDGEQEEVPSLTKVETAKEWLYQKLKEGPVPSNSILESAKAVGIKDKTLQRAKREMKVVSERQGDCWVYILPPPKVAKSDAKGATPENLTTLTTLTEAVAQTQLTKEDGQDGQDGQVTGERPPLTTLNPDPAPSSVTHTTGGSDQPAQSYPRLAIFPDGPEAPPPPARLRDQRKRRPRGK